ncbi:MAG: DUF523 and DUF1722 domain-containing protein [Calditrichia bacterium]
MKETVKPRVVLSKCLELEACRYNGQRIPNSFVNRLLHFVEVIPVCPEVEIGLGTPRDPIRIIEENGDHRLFQPASGKDVTAEMQDFSRQFLDSLPEVDGFILKSRSPSCGPRDVKVYPGAEKKAPTGRTAGFFGEAVLEKFGHLAVEDEGRLNNFNIREHFLTRLFTLARFRHLKNSAGMADLVQFHARHKLLYMAYNQTEMRKMGRIVANPRKEPLGIVLENYAGHLHLALRRMPGFTSAINVLMHGLGYFSKKLMPPEKAFFLEALENYRQGKVPLSVPVNLLQAWIVRFEEKYLAEQYFFQPFPVEFVEITDSGKGRTQR